MSPADERILNSHLDEDEKRAYLDARIAFEEEMLALSNERLAQMEEYLTLIDQQEFDQLLWESQMMHDAL